MSLLNLSEITLPQAIQVPFEYTVLYYTHDAAAGERLNVGVLLYCAAQRKLYFEISSSYARLSDAFKGFNGDQYRSMADSFRRAFQQQQDLWGEEVKAGQISLSLIRPPANLDVLVAAVWRDTDLALQRSPTRAGMTEDLQETGQYLYHRFVLGGVEEAQRQKRDDEDVWRQSFRDVLRRKRITNHLQPKKFQIDDFEYDFDYTFKNGHYHCLLPISFDYVDPSTIKNRISKLLGDGDVLSENSEVGRVYLLVGRPQNDSEKHQRAYRTAIRMLDQHFQVEHEVVEEDDAVAFSEKIEREMVRYHILTNEEPDT